jgi:hypothetical protein
MMLIQTVLLVGLGSLPGEAQPMQQPDRNPAEVRDIRPDPPEEMIDFLGRRRLCSSLRGDNRRGAAEWRRARSCDALADEEQRWRQMQADNPVAMAWLNDDPRQFELGVIVASSYHGPPGVRLSHVDQEGVDPVSGLPVELHVDAQAESGRYVRITAAWGDVSARTVQFPVSEFPYFDPGSIWMALGSTDPDGGLLVEARYALPRGYCGNIDEDDRPRLSIHFTRTAVTASRQTMRNCNGDYSDVPVELVTAQQALR